MKDVTEKAQDQDRSSEIQRETLQETPLEPPSFSLKWTKAINTIRKPLHDLLHSMTRVAAENPKRTIGIITFLSFAFFLIGLGTNFRMDSDEDMLWTPRDSPPVKHLEWIDDHSGFPEEPREFFLFFHNDGRNIVNDQEINDNLSLVFEALDVVRDLPGYDAMCTDSAYLDEFGEPECRVLGLTKFWNDDASVLAQDEDVRTTMSKSFFPDQSRVSEESLYGYPERNDAGLLESTQSFMILIYFADTDAAEDIEEVAVDKIVALDDAWKSNPNINLRVEVSAYSSFEEE